MGRVIRTSESVITPSSVSPVDIDYVKKHLKSIGSADDVLIASWILASAAYFEEQTGRQLMTTVREYWLDEFPSTNQKIEIPRPPLRSVQSVEYVDANGDVLSFTDGGSPEGLAYDVKAPAGPYARPGWVVPKYGGVWPVARFEPGTVRIQFTAGYGDSADDLPDLVKAALLLLVGQFDQFRSETHMAERGALARLPLGLDLMMDGFKSSALITTVLRSESSWG